MFFGQQSFLGKKKFLGQKKEKVFWVKKKFGSKKFWVKNSFFLSKKNQTQILKKNYWGFFLQLFT